MLSRDKPEGMEALFHAYYNSLVLWADTFLNHLAQAEDLVQELFIHIWEKGIYRELKPETLASFLFTAVRNRCLNLLEKKEVFNFRARVEDVVLLFEEYNGRRDEMEMRVLGEIENLSPRSREILYGIFVEGKKYREVAALLHISESSIKTVVRRAILKLREKIPHSALLHLFCKKHMKTIR